MKQPCAQNPHVRSAYADPPAAHSKTVEQGSIISRGLPVGLRGLGMVRAWFLCVLGIPWVGCGGGAPGLHQNPPGGHPRGPRGLGTPCGVWAIEPSKGSFTFFARNRNGACIKKKAEIYMKNEIYAALERRTRKCYHAHKTATDAARNLDKLTDAN